MRKLSFVKASGKRRSSSRQLSVEIRMKKLRDQYVTEMRNKHTKAPVDLEVSSFNFEISSYPICFSIKKALSS